ncbi:hypothetical protein AAF712_014458 [Marasmius tenuissimus]|uniref:Peroxidase n=1 Tax=Marasmius tenuissimus TaxID=585030 RepID=A0ABR2ZD57_9AGAR
MRLLDPTSWRWTAIAFLAVNFLFGYAIARDTQAIMNHLDQLLFENLYIADPNTGFPCETRDGTTTAAQWIRLAYHDMSTHNVDDGTGGLDGSIAFELDRPQNVGLGMLKSIDDLLRFMHPAIAFADVLAFAVVRAVANCGDGPTIPLRGGRIDAMSAGPEIVPEPHQDLASHTESFRRQGFTQSEMIALVACGHAVGGVRREDFPEVIHNQDVEFELFDGTNTFDHAVVQGYLDGTTSNPLVVGPNVTTNSDLRIFSSDGNVTMQRPLHTSLANPDTFKKTCGDLLERMINTVPVNVELTDPVTPIQYKLKDRALFVNDKSDGSYTFTATLRVGTRQSRSHHCLIDVLSQLREYNSKRKVKFFWNDRQGSSVCPTSGCSVDIQSNGPIFVPLMARQRYGLSELGFHNFFATASVNNTGSISKFWFQVDEGDGSAPFIVDKDWSVSQDDVLADPNRSKRNSGAGKTNVVIAVRGDSSSKVSILTWEVPITGGNPTPKRIRVDLSSDSRFPPVGGYTFFSGDVASSSFVFMDIDAQVGGKTIRELRIRRRRAADDGNDNEAAIDRITLRSFVEERCPSLFKEYRAPWWLFNGHLQTMYCVVGDFTKADKYSASDIQRRGLDFTTGFDDKAEDSPIVVVLHGLTGGSYEQYVRGVLYPACSPVEKGGLGYRAVVMNYRGCAGVPITSRQFYSAGYTDDVRISLMYIKRKYPNAPLLGLGFSLGANVLIRYLAEEQENSKLLAGCALGCPWDLQRNCDALDDSFIGRHVYSKGMASNLSRLLKRHEATIIGDYTDTNTNVTPSPYAHPSHQHDPAFDIAVAKAARTVLSLRSPTLNMFDDTFTCVAGGAPPVMPLGSSKEYYSWAASHTVLKDVRRPVLALNAADDPVVQHVPSVMEEGNEWTVVAVTPGGGHLGWFEAETGENEYRIKDGEQVARWSTAPVSGATDGSHHRSELGFGFNGTTTAQEVATGPRGTSVVDRSI